MSDEKTYTERDLIVAKRGAYIEGALADHNATGWMREMGRVEREAHEKYPLPTVTRPREVDYGIGWRLRVQDGEVYCRSKSLHGVWMKASGVYFVVNRAFVDACADLLANPTETVEDDQ